MDQGYWIHRTLRQQSLPMNILLGNWFGVSSPGVDYALINFHTHFQVFEIKTDSGVHKSKVMKAAQPYMSKVGCVCLGPKFGEVDTLYALRQDDIVHFAYSHEDGLFTARNVLQIPPLTINPTNIYYANGIITIACQHGAMASMKAETNEIISMKKNCGCVLCVFKMNDGSLARIEPDSTLVIYNIATLEIILKKSVFLEGHVLYFAFPYCDGVVLCYAEEQNDEANFFQFLSPNEEISGIEAFSELNSKIVSAAQFSDSCAGILTQKMEIFAVSGGTKIKLTKIPLKTESFLKLLPFTENTLCAVSVNENSILVSPPPTKQTIIFKTTIGQMGLNVSSPSTLLPFMASYTNTPTTHRISFLRQGVPVALCGSTELAEPVTDLFSTKLLNRRLIAISHPMSTQLIELSGNQFNQISFHGFKETLSTIGIGVLHANHTYFIHAKCDGISLIPIDQNGQELTHQPATNIDGIACVFYFASTQSQILICPQKRKIKYLEVPDDNKKLIPVDIDLHADCTAVGFSGKPILRPGESTEMSPYAETLVIATTEGNKHSLIFYQAKPYDSTKQATMLMMEKVISIVGLTDSLFCVGLENGILVIVRYPKGAKFGHVSNTCHVGNGPCRLTQIDKNAVLATNSRTWRITVSRKEAIKITPLAIHSLSFVSGISQAHFLSVTGHTMELFSVEPSNDLNIARFEVKDKIIKTCSLNDTPYLFVAAEKSIKIIDLRGPEYILEEVSSDEVIVDMAISTPFTPSNIPVIKDPKKPDSTSLLHLYVAILIHRGLECVVRVYEIPRPSPMTIRTIAVIEGVFSHLFSHIGILLPSTNIPLPLLIVSFESSLSVISCNFEEEEMNNISRLDNCGQCIQHIRTKDDLIFIGDSTNSVMVVTFNSAAHSLQIVSKDRSRRHITTLSPSLANSVCGGDSFGNVFNFTYTRNDTTSRNLQLALNYNVGDVVTGTDFTSELFNSVWYSTISGGIGGFISFRGLTNADWVASTNEKLNLLKLIEQKTAWAFASLTNCNSFEFHNRQFPSSGVIDLDVIELFFTMSKERQINIISSLKSKTNKPISPEQFTSTFMQFKNYFWGWRSKK